MVYSSPSTISVLELIGVNIENCIFHIYVKILSFFIAYPTEGPLRLSHQSNVNKECFTEWSDYVYCSWQIWWKSNKSYILGTLVPGTTFSGGRHFILF